MKHKKTNHYLMYARSKMLNPDLVYDYLWLFDDDCRIWAEEIEKNNGFDMSWVSKLINNEFKKDEH